MSKEKSYLIYMQDVINNLKDANSAAITYESFLNNKDKCSNFKNEYGQDPLKLYMNSIERSLEVVGEAAKRIPDETKDKYPDIYWRGITGIRDVIAHQYDKLINRDLLITAKEHAPMAIKELEKAIKNEKD